MTKKEFIEKVRAMDEPSMTFERPLIHWSLLHNAVFVTDLGSEYTKNGYTKFRAHWVKMSWKEHYNNGGDFSDHAPYEKREAAMIKKFTRWFAEAMEGK